MNSPKPLPLVLEVTHFAECRSPECSEWSSKFEFFVNQIVDEARKQLFEKVI